MHASLPALSLAHLAVALKRQAGSRHSLVLVSVLTPSRGAEPWNKLTFLWCKQSSWILFSQQCDPAASTPIEEPRIYSANRLLDATTLRKSRFSTTFPIISTQPAASSFPTFGIPNARFCHSRWKMIFDFNFSWLINEESSDSIFLHRPLSEGKIRLVFFPHVASAMPITLTKKALHPALFCGGTFFYLSAERNTQLCNWQLFLLFINDRRRASL